MAILAPGTQQREWRRLAPWTGTVSPLPSIDAYTYKDSLSPGYLDGNYVFEMKNRATSGEPTTDMCCALRFFFVKKTESPPPAVARIWGVSRVHLLGGSESAFLGVYIGQIGFAIGTSHGLPFLPDIPDIPKNVLWEDWHTASQVRVQHDRALSPPGLRVVGNSNAGSGRSPFVLFDAMGFDRIVVSLRYTDTYGSNGLGFFWTTM